MVEGPRERRHLDLAPGLVPTASPPSGDASLGQAGAALTDLVTEELSLLGDDEAFDATGLTLYHAAAVRLETARLTEYDGGDTTYRRGERVVCDTPSGIGTGEVAVSSRRVLLRATLPRILRRASTGDLDVEAASRAREQLVWKAAKDVAHELGLPLKVVRAEAVQGGAKFIVYFASDSKVSFRDWLRGTGRLSRERIELRQIGMRDAARTIGGVGPCELQLCCNTFLSDFTPVGIKMAKTQGLTLNPQKVSGLCGRLLCCLVYEEAHYRAGRKLLPEPGEVVSTPEGRGRVRDVDVLQMQVKVTLDSGETRVLPVADVARSGTGEASAH